MNPVRGASIGCTGEPLLQLRGRRDQGEAGRIVDHLEARFGEQLEDLRLYLDGCPHACGQHWVGDIGLQGTTHDPDDGQAAGYDLFLRGGLGRDAAIGRPLLRRVPCTEAPSMVERLFRA